MKYVDEYRNPEAARRLADAIQQGNLTSRQPARGALGPLLDWLILTGQQRGALLPAVQLAAEEYGRRAMTQAELARTFLPMTLTIAVGGTATLLFALLMCGPWFSLLHRLANPW